jgi:hypothetical protein
MDEGWMRVVIVTGSRDYEDHETVYSWLRRLGAEVVGEGACRTGADLIAHQYALVNQLGYRRYPADWYPNGKLDRSAGVKRNTHMLHCEVLIAERKEDIVVVGFPLPQSKGTFDCLDKACKYNLHTIEVRWDGVIHDSGEQRKLF